MDDLNHIQTIKQKRDTPRSPQFIIQEKTRKYNEKQNVSRDGKHISLVSDVELFRYMTIHFHYLSIQHFVYFCTSIHNICISPQE